MEEQAKKIAELLKLLANEHRLLILCALLKGRIEDERVIALIEAIKKEYCKEEGE